MFLGYHLGCELLFLRLSRLFTQKTLKKWTPKLFPPPQFKSQKKRIMDESSNNKKADFEKDRELFKKFFVEYTEGIEGTKPYYLKLRSIKDREAEGGVIELNLSHRKMKF